MRERSLQILIFVIVFFVMKTSIDIIISNKRVASAPLMQGGAHTEKRNATEADLHFCLPGPHLPFCLGFYIHPFIFSAFPQ